MIASRHPRAAATFLEALAEPNAGALPSLNELLESTAVLRAERMTNIPEWSELATNAVQPEPDHDAREPGEGNKGWQKQAADAREHHTRNEFFQTMPRDQQTLLRSQGGPYAGRTFIAIPTQTHATIPSEELRVLLSRRLRLDIPLTPSFCRCGRRLDKKAITERHARGVGS